MLDLREPQGRHPDRCRCSQCWGLAEFMDDLTGDDHGLPSAPGHGEVRLRVITTGTPGTPGEPASPCAGTLTCSCPTCQQERAERVQLGPRGSGRQPWNPVRRVAA